MLIEMIFNLWSGDRGHKSEEKEEELLGAGDRQDPSFSLQPILLEDLLALGLSPIQILRFPSPPEML